jgi:polysaccharide deacetylase 2 family uncharacterized protein YibQ
MAPQTKKKRRSSSPRTKRTTSSKKKLKSTGKRRTSSQKKGSGISKKWGVLFWGLMILCLVAFGYYLGKQDRGTPPPGRVHQKKVQHFQKSTHPRHVHTSKPHRKSPSVPKHRVSPVVPPPKKLQQHEKKKVSPPPKQTQRTTAQKRELQRAILRYRGGRPKLVIIIDDISNRRQLHRIQALGMPITPSIFPPSKLSMTSYRLARGLKHYMVHLPMESGNRQFNTQYKTLKCSFSKTRMRARVKEIRKLFPSARYINNHTGSIFTSHYQAMYRLYGMMKKEGFLFVDSRTTGATQVKKIAHAYGDDYIARDVFIDNIQTVSAIHRQLKKVVRIAKKRGYAIAIGHPHEITMQALAAAKDIFRGVELVYIDQIYKRSSDLSDNLTYF